MVKINQVRFCTDLNFKRCQNDTLGRSSVKNTEMNNRMWNLDTV